MAKLKIVNPDLGRRVARRRAALGLSQPALGRASAISQQNINTIEKGGVKRPGRILELAEALHTTVEWLLYGRGPEVVESPKDVIAALADDLEPEKLGAVIQFMKKLRDDRAA